MEIACSKAGDHISITYPETACGISVGPQEGLSALRLLNNKAGGDESGILVHFKIAGAAYSVSGGFFSCGKAAGSYTDGSYSGWTELYGGVA